MADEFVESVQVPFMACRPVSLDPGLRESAAYNAIAINPQNAPMGTIHPPERIAVLASKFWGDKVRDITVGFMEPTTVAIRDKVLFYANQWSAFTKAKFRWSKTNPMVRISFGPGGYYSYLGTDILSIPANEHTMNLEGFNRGMPESEWMRVVVHEFGHSLGAPHEHSRQDIIDLLDRAKVIASFEASQGWSQQEIIDQILTPVSEASLMGASPTADQVSIMTYSFEGNVTKSGQPIPGGNVLSAIDKQYMGKIYPMDPVTPPTPPVVTPPVNAGTWATMVALDPNGVELARYGITRK